MRTVRLPYVEQGDPDGTPVLLLHGITDSQRSWEPVLPLLPESIRAIAVTMRGHGDAERPEAALSETVRAVLASKPFPWGELAVLTAWAVLAPMAAIRWFRWEE